MKTSPINGKLVIRALELNGYVQKKVRGNHVLMSGYKGGNYFVVQANGEVPPLHLVSVLFAAGIPRKVFFQSVAKAKPEKSESLLSTIFSKKLQQDTVENKKPKTQSN